MVQIYEYSCVNQLFFNSKVITVVYVELIADKHTAANAERRKTELRYVKQLFLFIRFNNRIKHLLCLGGSFSKYKSDLLHLQ